MTREFHLVFLVTFWPLLVVKNLFIIAEGMIAIASYLSFGKNLFVSNGRDLCQAGSQLAVQPFGRDLTLSLEAL